MGDVVKTTKLFVSPTFLKGASRVVDLYGKLDEYNYRDDADCFALQNDWINVGNDMYISIEKNDKEKTERKNPTK